MPLSDFRWLTDEEIKQLDIRNDISDENPKGYFLEVDLHNPSHLHAKHNSFVLAPEHIEITENDLSDYSKACLRQFKHKCKRHPKEDGGKHCDESCPCRDACRRA